MKALKVPRCSELNRKPRNDATLLDGLSKFPRFMELDYGESSITVRRMRGLLFYIYPAMRGSIVQMLEPLHPAEFAYNARSAVYFRGTGHGRPPLSLHYVLV